MIGLPKGIHHKRSTGGYEAYVHANGRKYYAGYAGTVKEAVMKREAKIAWLKESGLMK
ncbi:hypothetical protein MED16_gp65 [Pantoea phage vB_PagS_MED16]|nr:hypothetical protein MED16_gp65 [Pantoea phage vB_PagS_MED16]